MRWFFIVLLGLIAACGSGQNFGLRVEFPDQEARDRTASIGIMIIEHSPEATCQHLLSGQVTPDSEGYAVVDSVTFEWTGEPVNASLELRDGGSYLFYAEAYDSEALKILNGCQAAKVGEGDVVIYLQWIADCTTDDDCDNDDLYCNGQTICVEGHCAFQDTDCSQLIDECNDATCDEEQDACVAVPLTETSCEDGYYCTVDDTCLAGSCQSGTDRDCSEAGGACVSDGYCDDDLDRCVGDPLTAGTPCDDGLYCTDGDTCDGAGACVAGDLLSCDDSEPCTVDSCSEAVQACANVWTEIPGAEGLNVPDTCDDSVDNDCDGSTDVADQDCIVTCVDNDGDGYGFPGDTTCPNGADEDCDDDPAGCGADCYPGNADVCDGNDNDCDPQTADGDDDPLLNTDCDGPDSDRCRDDTYEACTDGQLICSLGADDTEGPEGDATCSDLIDNDCDGATDNLDSGCIDACNDVDGDGFGNPGDPACPGGPEDDCDDDPAACGAACYPGATEICDGYDNDCDPASDDGSEDPLLGASCDGPDSDLCEEGTNDCQDGTLVCSDSTGDDLDLCNGTDDDCNPATADGSGEPDLGDPCDGSDSDLCTEGTYHCAGGPGLSCSDATGNSLDLCNGNDDDCNPATPDGADEPNFGDPCDGGDSDLCPEGNYVCAGGPGLVCNDFTANNLELCNGNDDDCNPATPDGSDETDFGDPCDGGDTDLCPEGTYVCAGGPGLTCDDGTGNDLDLCNGSSDDDCNPATPDGADEANFGSPCDGGDTDLCPEGTYVCTGGPGLACNDATGNNYDLCNGSDDDCNPATADGSDEPNLGDPCDGSDSDLCPEGNYVCTGGPGLACNDTTGNTPDLCNGSSDDDCNPATPDGTDEPNLGNPCDGPDSDLCTEGTYYCAGGPGLACNDATGNNYDLCNGNDDDCNSATADGSDEPNLGDPCDGGDTDLCLEGNLVCTGGPGLACNDTTGNTPDLCNGSSDDDCNPATPDGTDEPNLGNPCDGPDSDLCTEGTYYCAGGPGLACNDTSGDDLDLCNGTTNDDCNPATADGADELGLGDPCDGGDTDLCEEGNLVCTGGPGLSCNDTTGSSVEICGNGSDDDCNPATPDDGNTILGGDFEDGTPNPYWTEFSTNWETPLCTVSCGLGGGTGPYQGDWWAWFGGDYDEEGILSQTVIIPVGANTLRWYMELPDCESGSYDWFEIKIDDNQVYYTDGNDPRCNMVGYQQRSIDISTYADGASHTILFYGFCDGSLNTNFFVDNVELVCQ